MTTHPNRLVQRTSQRVFFSECEEFDFHLLNALSYTGVGAGEIGECFAAVQDVADYDFDAWRAGWRAIGDVVHAQAEADVAAGHLVSARAGYLRAWNYYGQSEFFVPAGSGGSQEGHERTMQAFGAAAALPGPEFRRLAIPFEGLTLPGWFFPAQTGRTQRTLIVMTGNDGMSEHHYFSMGGARAAARGWNLLCFDGPGQWGARFSDERLVWRHDYEVVLRAVVDDALTIPEVDPDAIAVLGLSAGGYLAPRGVSGEPRVKALVANPPCVDFHAMIMPPVERLLAHGDPNIEAWVRALFEWSFGVESMDEVEERLRAFNLDGLVEQIACPTLVLASAGEGGMAEQLEAFCSRLPTPPTRRRFTAAEGADCHCQYNNWTLSQQVVYDWLESVVPPSR